MNMNMTHGGQNKYRENREYFKRKPLASHDESG